MPIRSVDSSPLRPDLFGKKIGQVVKQMRDDEIDLWVTVSRESNEDPMVSDLGLDGIVFPVAAVFDSSGERTALVGHYDVETVRKSGFYNLIVDYEREGAVPALCKLVRKRKPRKIAVNTSENFPLADGLSSGLKQYLQRGLGEYGGTTLVSSENLIVCLRTILVPEELELVKRSISKCEEIFRATEEGFMKRGRTDKEIHEFMLGLVREQGLERAWEQAPAMHIGGHPESHMAYRNEALEAGDFLKIDFGVKYEGYCSDIQRVYFVGSGAVPRPIRKAFETAVSANDAAIDALRAGVQGWLVDKAARDVVTSAGYPDYPHGTGHPLGRFVHDVGPSLGPLWPERAGGAEKTVQAGMVFTIEPSIRAKEGACNLEQDVLVGEGEGVVRLSSRQHDLIYIK